MYRTDATYERLFKQPLRIQVSTATVKALHARLQQAYLKDDVRLVRRTTVLIDLLMHHVPMAVMCERGASVLPVSTPGKEPFCCTAWRVCAPAMAAVVGRS